MLFIYLRNMSLIDNSFHFFFNDTSTTEIYTLSLHDALPICRAHRRLDREAARLEGELDVVGHHSRQRRSEEHTSELQSRVDLVCRLLLEKKKKNNNKQDKMSIDNETSREPYTNVNRQC